MVVIHRVYLETLYSNPVANVPNLLEHNNSRSVDQIIILDGGEDTPMEAAGPENTPLTIHAGEQQADADLQLTETPINNVNHESGDAGLNLIDSYMQADVEENFGDVDGSRAYWESLLTQGNEDTLLYWEFCTGKTML
ncbi:unnamed protein product [Arabis nemorensis]|uniref:Uncharacterized protein n=1 Tax=Arabis nemorensis TaxID=586526 RepID=A0A565BK60_9BRAS|nr:unnamed protein product [Arabis nemorensis]